MEATVTEASSNEAVRGVPDWASAPLRAFVDDQERLTDLVYLATRGIAQLQNMAEVNAFLQRTANTPEPAEEAARKRALAERVTALATKEVSEGFPLLYAQAAVSRWSALEVLVRDLVAATLAKRLDLLCKEPISRLRVRVGEYEALTGDERSAYLVELLEQELQATFKLGIGRFECLLASVGLAGAVPEAIRRELFELSQVRNVLVHRRGIADKKFVERCPWLSHAVGTEVRVSHASLGRSYIAAVAYVLVIHQRLKVLFGEAPSQAMDNRILAWEAELERAQRTPAAG